MFECQKQLRFACLAIPVLVDDPHGRDSLLLIDAIRAASHREDIIEEQVELVGIEGAGIVAVIPCKNLVDVALELVIVDHLKYLRFYLYVTKLNYPIYF